MRRFLSLDKPDRMMVASIVNEFITYASSIYGPRYVIGMSTPINDKQKAAPPTPIPSPARPWRKQKKS